MSINNKVRAMLSMKGLKPHDLAECLGISVQAVRNKFSRDTLSVSDLIKIADHLGCTLQFDIDGQQKIILDVSDLKDGNVSAKDQ